MIRHSVALALACLALPAVAQDWIASQGDLSDDDFYRLVSCGAPPGGDCADSAIRWPGRSAADLTIGIGSAAPDYPDWLYREVSGALDAAIAEINAVGAAVRLRRIADGDPARIRFFLTDTRVGEMIAGVGASPPDGTVLEAALVQIDMDWSDQITNGYIILARDILPGDIHSVVLEETTQALGFLHDIRNPHYEGRSVFSEDSNALTELGPQDRMVLLRHYPPGE